MTASAAILRKAAGVVAVRARVSRSMFQDVRWMRGTGRHPPPEWGICLSLLYRIFRASLPEIAAAFGYADHTAVRYQINRAEHRMRTIPSAADFAIRAASEIERVFAPTLRPNQATPGERS